MTVENYFGNTLAKLNQQHFRLAAKVDSCPRLQTFHPTIGKWHFLRVSISATLADAQADIGAALAGVAQTLQAANHALFAEAVDLYGTIVALERFWPVPHGDELRSMVEQAETALLNRHPVATVPADLRLALETLRVRWPDLIRSGVSETVPVAFRPNFSAIGFLPRQAA